MRHQSRWTAQKLTQRLALIEPLVYRHWQPLAPFRYTELEGPHSPPPVGREVHDADWPVIEPQTYWATWQRDFVLRTCCTIPADWPTETPVAISTPLQHANGTPVHTQEVDGGWLIAAGELTPYSVTALSIVPTQVALPNLLTAAPGGAHGSRTATGGGTAGARPAPARCHTTVP